MLNKFVNKLKIRNLIYFKKLDQKKRIFLIKM